VRLPDIGRVLLAGATGYIGRCVASELVNRGYSVSALVRPSAGRTRDSLEAQLPGCSPILSALDEASEIQAALGTRSFDAVISCVASRNGAPDDAWHVDYSLNSHLLEVARAMTVGHFVLLSAICVQRPRLAFQHAKLAFEKRLRESGVAYSIVRPTAYFKSLAGQVERVKAGKPFLVFGDGRLTACKPISESDLAGFIVDCLEDPAKRNQVLPLGGPGPAITPREQGAMLCELAGKPVRYRHVSPRLFDLAETILAPLSHIVPPLAAKAEFARIGRYYATESMLVWDEAAQDYDANATPSHGNETLRAFYARVLQDGLDGQELGEHKLFSR
jgi:divinyl chlorophyllide a 8-vinyl-reductase